MPKQNKINKIIRFLIVSDIFFNSGWGLVGPIFAIYLLQDIQGGSAQVAGFATAIYWITKSMLQIPLAKYLDRNHGEKDDFSFMIGGLFIAGLVPFGYLISFLPWHIYILQVVYAIGMAMTIPAWYAIFTRHIDRGSEAYEWSVYSTMLGFAIGISGAIGGLVVGFVGFKTIYFIVGIFTITSSILLLFVKNDLIYPHPHKKKPQKSIPPWTPF
jgi:predicted MFS family arabinose efflux permease